MQVKLNYKSDFEMQLDSDKNEKNTARKLIGSEFDDRLVGGNSNDKLNGKKGADIYVLSSGRDKFKGFKLKEGDTIEIDSDISFTLVQTKRNTLIKHDDGVTTVFKVNKDELTNIIEIAI